MTTDNCVFCKIISGEIPTPKIYEDENFVSFLDINPVSKGHLLLIPKVHIEWMHEASDSLIKEIFILVKKMMKNIIEKLPCDYVQVAVVGKDVPHFHIHLIPRNLGDDIHHKEILKYSDGEIEATIEKLKM